MMAIFQHVLWGYELAYPDDWFHRTLGEVEGFSAIPEALESDYEGPSSGQILVSAEWNCARQSIEPIWNRHVGMLASWLGARQVGSAPWRMGGAAGIEAEIVLPKKDERRLWTGILEKDLTVLHFVVLHLKKEYDLFQSKATEIISSLRFPSEIAGVHTSQGGFPLPPGYSPASPQDLIDDIQDAGQWLAFDGQAGIGGLQAFYLREAENYGWSIKEYVPFPSPADLGFARLKLEKEDRRMTLGLMPYPGKAGSAQPARIVIKLG